MQNRKLQKSQQRRADLENLGLMLGIAERFNPRQDTQDQIEQERLQTAMLGNQQTRALAPFATREAEARIGSVEDDRGQRSEMHPLLIQEMQKRMQGQDQSMRFAEELQPGIVAGQGYNNQLQDAQAQVAQGSIGPAIASAGLGVQGQVLQNAGQGIENKARGYQLKQARKMDPLSQQQLMLEILQQKAGLTMGQPSGEVDDKGNPIAAQFDLQRAAGGLGVDIPFVDNSFSPGRAIDAQISQGLPDATIPEGMDWYEQQVPQLAAAMQAQPDVPWSLQSQALAELYNNPANYGIAVDPAKGMRQIGTPYDNGMTRLQQAMELIKQRQQQRQPYGR